MDNIHVVVPHSSKCAEVQAFIFKTLVVREARDSLDANPRVHYEVTQYNDTEESQLNKLVKAIAGECCLICTLHFDLHFTNMAKQCYVFCMSWKYYGKF